MTPAPRLNMRRLVVPAGFVLYVVAASFVSCKFRHLPSTSVFDLQFLYGPLVKNLLTSNLYASPDMQFTGYRMPFIPYFLAAVAFVRNDVFLAYVVKNLIFCSITLLALITWRNSTTDRSSRLWFFAIALLGTFPQFVFWATSPDADEGYLIHLMAALSIGLFMFEKLIRSQKWGTLAVLGLLNALLYLTKSSMLPLSISICFLYWFKSSDLKVLGVFGGILLGAVTLWGCMNVQHSGKFAISTSLDGWNLYKGNNGAALSLYPKYNLDILDMEGLTEFRRPAGMNEWAFDSAARSNAIEFAIHHPLDELRLMGRRLFVLFVEVRRNPLYRGESQFESPVYWFGTFYMTAFRIVFWVSLWRGVRRLWSHFKKPPLSAGKEVTESVIFLTIFTAYALPYLAGFVYERHLMPLIVPTLLYWFSSNEHLTHNKVLNKGLLDSKTFIP